MEFIMLQILLTSDSLNPLNSRLMTNFMGTTNRKNYMLFYFLQMVINVIMGNYRISVYDNDYFLLVSIDCPYE
ncbi:hypothetical protein C922_05638 [Plasmodium inui San Antonio 1]|uniref:Uncharacterized protein n=1 Tax=Plasmodium inui San Antonio 1 TaxID=1237626 RepID=W6ZSS8_9APIC|nr:hypothetical protein C922_05638 [Plasmodium inui San Antonio 1]EUD63977.1 hypothetical protein C922_05638 [Plasmodium inui San Antonio 1]